MKNSHPTEIELKLALTPDGPRALTDLPLLGKGALHTLTNTYYDTPQSDLARARIAVRLRQLDGDWLQTVKTAGQGGGGLSERQEWEWPLDAATLDTARLATLPPFQAQSEHDLRPAIAHLAPQLSTDFQRTRWELDWQDARIEVVLDQGEIKSGSHRAPIRELELELKQGNASALWSLARALAEHVALRPSDSSKAARGNALAAQAWPLLDAQTPSQWLSRATLALDAFHDSGRAEHLNAATAALAQLAAHPDLPKALAPQAATLCTTFDAHGHPTRAYGQAALALAQGLAAIDALG